MPAKPVVFKESDVRRALRAGSKEKFPIDRYEIATDGTIRVFAVPPCAKDCGEYRQAAGAAAERLSDPMSAWLPK